MEHLLNINDLIEGELLHESKKTKVYKAVHANNSQRYVVKKLKKQDPPHEEIEQFIQEYEITKRLHPFEGIGTYQLFQQNNGHYLVMDDFEGKPLNSVLSENKFPLGAALEVSVRIADVLSNIHQKNIIHKDINPSNILWNNEKNEIRVIDFGFSCYLSHDINEIMTSTFFDGTLQYISPEQTGRINMTIDFRTDLYSLGVTLYQMFAHKLPFTGDDAIELVHSHIAKSPVPVHEVSGSIPRVLSDIIMKLLAKDPDERYQSALGLKKDLEFCLEKYKETGKIASFEIGKHDFSGRLQISQKIYGRDKEVDILLQGYERTRKGKNELILVTGNSGTGKSLLVSYLQKPVLQQNGFFIKGQFDRFKKTIPLHAFSQAFKEFIDEILGGTEKSLTTWKNEFISIFGPNGKIIADIVPELEQIIGKQSEPQQLNPVEARNRFLMLFRGFIKSIARKEHPLVIFLDDVQWGDRLSELLIKDITINEIPYLMLICAVRNKDDQNAHVVNHVFDEIQKVRYFERLNIASLSLSSVNELVADSLHAKHNDTEELSKILFSKTNGNPFFTKELLKTIYKDGLIYFNFNNHKWEWNSNKINEIHISENLIEIIINRIKKLPVQSIDTLKVAACIGSNFDLKTIAAILNKPLPEVSAFLFSALEQGIIYAKGSRFNVLTENDGTDINIAYMFQHYRIQQTVYGLIDEVQKNDIHFHIGKYLLKSLSENTRNDLIIEIVSHLNYGLENLQEEEEKKEFALLNLYAAEMVKASSAYTTAISFYEKGISLLSPESWRSGYDLVFKLYKGFADCAYQIGRYDDAENHIDIILENVLNKLDKVSVIAMRLRQYATMGKPNEAIAEGIKALALLGVKLSPNPRAPKVLFEILLARMRQGKRKTADLINLPVLNDPEKKMIARLLTEMGAPAYTLGNHNLYGILALKVVNLSLKYGYTPELPYALVAYGMLQGIAFGNLKAANDYGKLAIALDEKYNELEYRCRVISAYGVLTYHWNNHWGKLSRLFKKGIEAGIHSGDIFYLAHSASNCIIWDPKLNFQAQVEEHKKYIAVVRETGFADALDTSEMRLQVLLNLMGETDDRFSLTGKGFDEGIRLSEMTKRNYISGIAMFHLAKAEIYLNYGEALKAYQHVEEVDKLVSSLVGLNYTFILSVVAFHSSAQIISNKGYDEFSRRKYRLRMQKEINQMQKWAIHNPTNYLHHLYLMQAEMAKIKGRLSKAAFLYEKAIENAGKNLWLKDKAFCYELAGRFFKEQKLDKASIGYIQQASYLYGRLGAGAKVMYLAEIFPMISDNIQASGKYQDEKSGSLSRSRQSSSTTSIGLLDMNTITKASQTISGEVVLETLLKKLMQITVENAGAQRGVLLLAEKGKLIIQAENTIENNRIDVLQSIEIQDYSNIPHSIINYVSNSKKSVVLSDAGYEGMYTQDPYILDRKPKSVLAEPILKLNQLHGIIYLENNLNAGVFSEERQQILNILSTQIAISIENSKLYESLEEKIDERTAELVDANKQLSKKNEQIHFQKEELEKLNASKDKMFSIIAHDLRSPFSVVLGSTELLSENIEGLSKEEIEDMASGIHQSALKVYALLDNLLNWAMSQTGKIIFNPQPVSLKDIVDEVIYVLAENSVAKKIRVVSEVGSSVTIFADKHMLYSILRNLVNNAIKYCHRKGRIRVLASNISGSTHVSVIDDGVGMEAVLIERLFDVSKDITTPGTANEQGTGLGLILCKEFVEKHGGKIWVESQPGKGSNFQFSLPAGPK